MQSSAARVSDKFVGFSDLNSSSEVALANVSCDRPAVSQK